MAVSLILLEIKKVSGDALVFGYENHIVVDAFSWSVAATVEEKETAGPMTKIDAKAMNIKKQFDRSSTVLRDMMRDDKPFNATLRFIDPVDRSETETRKADAICEIQLVDCHIDPIALSADDTGKSVSLSEDLTISYATSATITYRSYNPLTRSRGNAMTAELPTFEK